MLNRAAYVHQPTRNDALSKLLCLVCSGKCRGCLVQDPSCEVSGDRECDMTPSKNVEVVDKKRKALGM